MELPTLLQNNHCLCVNIPNTDDFYFSLRRVGCEDEKTRSMVATNQESLQSSPWSHGLVPVGGGGGGSGGGGSGGKSVQQGKARKHEFPYTARYLHTWHVYNRTMELTGP